jgi:hypothetical protein
MLVQGEKLESSFSLLQVEIQFSQHYFLKRLSSPAHILGIFVKNQMAVVTSVYVSVFYSIPLVSVSAFVPAPCLFYYDDFVV